MMKRLLASIEDSLSYENRDFETLVISGAVKIATCYIEGTKKGFNVRFICQFTSQHARFSFS